MIAWLSANIGTIIVVIVLIAIVVGIIFWMRHDKKQGRSSCGGNCGSCHMQGACHSKPTGKKEN